MGHQCDKTEVINYIKDYVEKIDVKNDFAHEKLDSKLDSVIEFKNKAIGIIIAFTTITTMTFNLIVFIFKK